MLLVYDGPGQLHNNYYEGWDDAKANVIHILGAATRHPNHKISGSTFDSPNFNFKLRNLNHLPAAFGYADANDDTHPRVWGVTLLDEDGSFPAKVNPEIVNIQRVSSQKGEQQLKELIQSHAELTGSPKAQMILRNWSEYLPQFWQVVPPSEADSPEASAEAVEERVLTPVQ